MAILRKQKRDRYTVIDNAILEDTELSLKAKGMLCLMLSLPDNWDFTISGLTKKSRDGKSSVMATLNELEDAGYFRRTQIKENGKFAGIEYIVSETRMCDSPYTENQNSENWDTESRTQVNTNITNTNKTNTNKRFIEPTLEEVQEYIEEKNYSVDAERFIDYYTANGWMVGKNRMKDWKATIRNWERNNGNDTGAGYRERRRVSEDTGGTYGGSSASGEGVRTKLPPMAAMSYEDE